MQNKSFQNLHEGKVCSQASKPPLTPFERDMLPEGTYLFNVDIISSQTSKSPLPKKKKAPSKAPLFTAGFIYLNHICRRGTAVLCPYSGVYLPKNRCKATGGGWGDLPRFSSWKTYPKLLLTILTLGLCLPSSITAYAMEVAQVTAPPNLPQTLPPPQDVVPPPSLPSQQRQVPSPSSPQDLLPIQPTQPTEEAPTAVPEKFLVTKFEFVGGTVFKDEQLLLAIEKGLLAGGDNRFCPPLPSNEAQCQRLPRTEADPPVEITFAQLLEARSAITQFYIDKGYITSGALIPEQALPPGGGVVTIQLAEGSLEDIKIIGNQRLNPNYIRSRLQRANQKPLNRDRLLEALQVLQLNPLIESLSAELSTGSSFGSNLLLVKVKEARSFNTQISLDNNRSPSVGSFQRSIQLREGNLLGIGDGVNLRYANTDGSNQVDVGYTLPLSSQNTTLSFNYGYSSNNVIEEPFDELDISSNSSEYQLTLRHPVIQTPRQELALGLTAAHRESQTFLGFKDTGGFPLSPGADDKGRTKVTALRFFQEFTQRGDRSVFALRSQFSLGLDALDATINHNDEPDSRFFAWRGQAQLVRLLAPDTILLIRGDVQLADRRLLSSEQIGLGGQASIRGYRQDLLLADNGAFGSVELRLPILRLRKQQALLQVVPFVDLGTAWNNSGGADIETDFLASAGVGLRFQLSDRLNARFDWGIPIVSVDSGGRTQQEDGLYLSVLWNPF
ncbi:hemolysin activation/secretion protein [Cylindrospermum stagnale PCC 7417]|uniref:Hemolysin activation/secretion protein n=1 Tax=Cylindrospermum stagnale PCC 7417 TaxID=56107 RepID=K9X0I2_9NOST|nr:ShlB/FhaC/HecB family hemolysin secretion/activation protein [Cylindrospermum stagnale]AFZ26110.1 hemolysin activation/secretion protein [Cylindrospermum stagnale PCC 7417]